MAPFSTGTITGLLEPTLKRNLEHLLKGSLYLIFYSHPDALKFCLKLPSDCVNIK